MKDNYAAPFNDKLPRHQDPGWQICDSQRKTIVNSAQSSTFDSQTKSCASGALAKWGTRLALLAILLTAAYATSINVADPDLWGHVQYGQDVLADGRIHETTTYSFTAVGFRWINHENLAELSFATIFNSIGPIGLLAFKFALSLLVFGLIIRRCQKNNVHLLVTVATVLLVANAISYFWSIRPQLFTFTYFALLVALLNWCFYGWNERWNLKRCSESEWKEHEANATRPIPYDSSRLRFLWLAPVLFFFWTNSHGGFAAGIAIYIAYLGIRGIEVWRRFGNRSYGLLRRFGLMATVAVLATLINPYGPGLHNWMLESLGSPRPEITEWAATDFLGENGWRFGLVVLATGFSLLFSRKEKDFTHLVLLGLTMWQAIEHHRHVPFYAIFFGFWMPKHLQSALMRFRLISRESKETEEKPGERKSAEPESAWPVFAGSLACIVLLIAALLPRLSVIKVEKEKYPVSAFAFMADHGIHGRMIVTYNWAQYAIMAFKQNPNVTGAGHISFDGRFRTCYPQQIVDMHFDFICGDGGPEKRHRGEDSPAYDGSRILNFNHPELAIISRRQKHSVHMMEQNLDDWSLLYQDKLTQVWGRKTVFDDPESSRFLPPSSRKISDAVQTGYSAWPAIKSRPPMNSSPGKQVLAHAE